MLYNQNIIYKMLLKSNGTMLETNVEEIKESIGILLLYVILWVVTELIKIVYYVYKAYCPPKILDVVEEIQNNLGEPLKDEENENKEQEKTAI